jgi:hypothetical protein
LASEVLFCVKLSNILSLLLLLGGRGAKTTGRTQDPDVFENQCFGMPSDVRYYRVNTLLYRSYCTWHAVARLVEALRYKPEGRGFDSFGIFY